MNTPIIIGFTLLIALYLSVGIHLAAAYVRVAINEGVEEGWLRLIWAVIVILFFWFIFVLRK